MKRSLVTVLLFLLPLQTLAVQLTNPLGGTTRLNDLIIIVLRGLLSFIAIGAVFMFIYGGFMMLTSGGNSDQIQRSREVLKWTALAIVFIVLSTAIINFIFQLLGYSEGITNVNDLGRQIGLGGSNLKQSALAAIQLVLGLLGIVGVTMLIYGGYAWLTSAGNSSRLEHAQEIIRAAVVGLVIILLSWSIVRYIILRSSQVTTLRLDTQEKIVHTDSRKEVTA